MCYVDYVIWGKRAPIFAQYTGKGKKVMLEGRLQTKSWESADGKKMYKLVLNVENFEFLSPQGQGQTSQPEPEHTPDYGDDDIPF